MAGIYIHIPYCKQKCSYCNFHFSTNQSSKKNLIESLKKEIISRKDELNHNIETIYFGGGTPSILDFSELEDILNTVSSNYKISTNVEITLEANPEDLNPIFLKQIHNLGINRLSIGIQSFFDEDLKLMNRCHSGFQAENSIIDAKSCGFENISVDLIYGIQNSSLERWDYNVQKIIDLDIPHISCYALTIEKNTELYHKIKTKQISDINEDIQFKEFEYLQKTLINNNFSHYEISNFAKKDFYSKHNTSYWLGKPYLGIGPSAHSFNGDNIRRWNISNNQKYIQFVQLDKPFSEQEILSENDRFNELIMIGLRTEFGVNIKTIEQFSQKTQSHFKEKYQEINQKEYLYLQENHIKIKHNFWFLADGIARDFFILD